MYVITDTLIINLIIPISALLHIQLINDLVYSTQHCNAALSHKWLHNGKHTRPFHLGALIIVSGCQTSYRCSYYSRSNGPGIMCLISPLMLKMLKGAMRRVCYCYKVV